ncbi:hypothetical protein HUU05_19600 [candidate division KSB1 bacterium]|nr:hypothetical protein [candidate division KSB1 bacterium]
MKMPRVFWSLFLLWAGGVNAQISFSNLFEYQLGNLPSVSPRDLSTAYNQLNLSYRYRYIKAFAKFESFTHPEAVQDYYQCTQRGVRAGNDKVAFTAGNFYEIIGRGLLLRSYEIPGTVREDIGYRVRHGFYRDLGGVLLKYQSRALELKALRARPLYNSFPPTLASAARRPSLVDGFEANVRVAQDLSIGGAYLRSEREQRLSKYSTIYLNANLPFEVQLYSEFAQQLRAEQDWFDFSEGSSHAFYASANYIAGPLGLSLEAKDYNDFVLLFNDPPPLIKEHSYVVLNRSTHVLEPDNESGWQAEASLRFNAGHTLTLNASQAENEFFGRRTVFKELFAEFEYVLDEETSVKVFADRSHDPFKLEEKRDAFGAYLDKEWPQHWGTILDVEYQIFAREALTREEVKNYAVSFTLAHARGFSVGVLWERSTDPLLADNPITDRIETKPRHWLGGTLGYKYSERHFLNAFYGKRRGGPACTAGICYEVLDFEGLEVRWTSNF